MSGEVDVDVYDSYRLARKVVEETVNDKIRSVKLSAPINQWAFIAIIRERDDPNYDEIFKRHRKDQSLEFRLKIDHKSFKERTSKERELMIVEALRRSVEHMAKLSVSNEDRVILQGVLDDVESELRNTVNDV